MRSAWTMAFSAPGHDCPQDEGEKCTVGESSSVAETVQARTGDAIAPETAGATVKHADSKNDSFAEDTQLAETNSEDSRQKPDSNPENTPEADTSLKVDPRPEESELEKNEDDTGQDRCQFLEDNGYEDPMGDTVLASPDWQLHLGPLIVGSEGLDLKPQIKLGFDTSSVLWWVGLGDVRDSIFLMACFNAYAVAHGEGHSLAELHVSMESDVPGVKQLLKVAMKIFDVEMGEFARIAHYLGYKLTSLERILAGDVLPSAGGGAPPPIQLTLLYSGLFVGLSWKTCFGWTDTQGYNMVGWSAAVLIRCGVSVFAGRHKTGTSMKIILGSGSLYFTYVIPTDPPPPPSPDLRPHNTQYLQSFVDVISPRWMTSLSSEEEWREIEEEESQEPPSATHFSRRTRLWEILHPETRLWEEGDEDAFHELASSL